MFKHVDLSHSEFIGCELFHSEFHQVSMHQGKFENSNLSASVWRLCELSELDLSGNDLSHSYWIRNRYHVLAWPKQTPQDLRFAPLMDKFADRFAERPNQTLIAADILMGHSGPVTTCAFSPDGRHILSGSYDQTLRLWDTETGECIYTAAHLPEYQSATIDENTNRIRYATDAAWRWLGYRDFNPETGEARIWPAEIFGPLPD